MAKNDEFGTGDPLGRTHIRQGEFKAQMPKLHGGDHLIILGCHPPSDCSRAGAHDKAKVSSSKILSVGGKTDGRGEAGEKEVLGNFGNAEENGILASPAKG